MRDPLDHRLLRELKEDYGKYLTIFLLLVLSIGFVSGFLVADNSMIIAYDESFEKYNIEDGHFMTVNKLNRGQKQKIEENGVQIHDLFYSDRVFDSGYTLRLFAPRTEVDLVCLMDGKMPEREDEIALDRMFADNNHLRVGDTINENGTVYTVCGLAALSDYSTLFADNNDSMFDAIRFGTAIVAEERFAGIRDGEKEYCYAWKYDRSPANKTEEKEMADAFLKNLNRYAAVDKYIPRYLNQAIIFTGDDMGSDKAMMEVLLYIIILIMAFVFSLTISDTIRKEAGVIGTLRASGYTRNELIRHYMTLPLAVTLFSALIGNILGYTFFRSICAGLYYASYSLPTYVTVWNADAFISTTVYPVLIMIAVTYLILRQRLSLSPLQFLRRDLSRKKNRRAVKLPHGLPFFSRFRTRVILQNKFSYLILWIGLVFSDLLLFFGLGLPQVLKTYEKNIGNQLFAQYQYILTMPASAADDSRKLDSLFTMIMFANEVETKNETAEKFSAGELKMLAEDSVREESVLLYGVNRGSRYITYDFGEDVYISQAYADKFSVKPGDTVRLKEEFEDKIYSFEIAGIFPYDGSMALFMDRQVFNRTFDTGSEYFSGYFSDTPITDIDTKYIGTVIDRESLTKISRQLEVSMGSMMDFVNVMSVLIFLILMYLLTKIIIEKNAQSISMAKILGYDDREINRLYVMPTGAAVLVMLVSVIPLEYYLMGYIYKTMIVAEMSGWIPYVIEPSVFIRMFVYGVTAYAVIAVLEYRKIRKIPMDQALKNTE